MIEIGNKKADMIEVHAFADNLQQISSDIQAQLESVIKSIDTIQGMSSFSGQATQVKMKKFMILSHQYPILPPQDHLISQT